MRDLKFRAWDKKRKEWYGSSSPTSLTFYDFSIFGECTLLCSPRLEDLQHLVITEYIGVKDSKGKNIYEGDLLYHEQIGRVAITFPYITFSIELLEEMVIKGNIFEGIIEES